jgi:hypothetical protein
MKPIIQAIQGWLDSKKRPLKQKNKIPGKARMHTILDAVLYKKKVSTFLKYNFKEYKAKLIARFTPDVWQAPRSNILNGKAVR